MKYSKRSIIFPAVVSFLLLSCTFTTTTPKQPVWAITREEFLKKLKEIVVTEKISFNGSTKITNGKIQLILKLN